ncbi:unnamed protein product [Lactuca saligna]|uniref:Uncharacterized protein n=1 Tax=Lactuca saligna TaxID=75948 RepID=A0AA35Y2F1_LACSI|nr:unnamed protein product [Lactuca saligna]
MLMSISGTETTLWFCVVVLLRLASQFPKRIRILEGNLGDALTSRYVLHSLIQYKVLLWESGQIRHKSVQDPFRYCKIFIWLDLPLPSEDYKSLMYQMHLALVGMADGNAQLEQVNVDHNRRLMLMMKLLFIMVMLFAVMLVTGILLLVKV